MPYIITAGDTMIVHDTNICTSIKFNINFYVRAIKDSATIGQVDLIN